jgi:hypothetical protein
MFTPMHAISAAALALSLSAFAYAAEVSPADSTPAPVQEEPRDTTRVPANDQATPGMSQEDYETAMKECDRLTSAERRACIDEANAKMSDNTPAPVQEEPRDSPRVPSTGQSKDAPEQSAGEPVRDNPGNVQDDEVAYRAALKDCESMPTADRERCIDNAKEKHGRM